MTVTSHVYPKAASAIFDKTIDLATDTFKAVLFTGDASAWGSTQEAYQYLSDLKTAYTEVAGGGDYARQAISGLSVSVSGAKVIWTCTSPISFGSDVTITARSMCIVDESVGSADASYPVICIIDFGQNYSSTASEWEYTVDGTNGLAYSTSS